MPGVRIFVDSTTFLYALDETEPEKRAVCRDWLRQLADAECGVTSLQALNETASVLIRKVKRFPGLDVAATIDGFAPFGAEPVTWPTTLEARRIHDATRYAWWDCLLLASAIELGCTHFLSEDMQDGRMLDGLTILSPFAHSPRNLIA